MIVALTSLIAAAFLAATPLPMQSEAVFVALQGAGALPIPTMVVVAGLANTAGSVVTWALGRGLRRLEGRFAPPADKLARAEEALARGGDARQRPLDLVQGVGHGVRRGDRRHGIPRLQARGEVGERDGVVVHGGARHCAVQGRGRG